MKVKFIKLAIAMSICLMLLLVAIFKIGYNWGTWHTQDRLLIQERTHSWLKVNTTIPDSICFISFGKDTTWYKKISN